MKLWARISGTMERTTDLLGRCALGLRGAATIERAPAHSGALDASHNAGVGSSSLPPAISFKSRLYHGLYHGLDAVARLARRALGTTGGTKPHRNVRLELDLRAIQRDRQLLHYRLALRSGTLYRCEW
jgi:microcystin-dependent protein